MYIERLRLENVKLLADQEFSFVRPDGSPRMWTVIVGENGLCKTTILQAIALAALGPKHATVVVRDAQRYRSVRNRRPSLLSATFLPSPYHESSGETEILSSLAIEPDRHDFLETEEGSPGASVLDEVRGSRRSGYFVAGYGVGRFLARPGEVALPENPVVDRLQGLFEPRHKILGIGFFEALRGFKSGKLLASLFNNALRMVLEPNGDRLIPGLRDLRLESPPEPETSGGLLESSRAIFEFGDSTISLPADWLSDGYQAMLAWVADLLGQAVLDRFLDHQTPAVSIGFPNRLRGLVLLDEIDLHLHPTWQRRVVPTLKRIFPRLQFIVTTHSPLVLAGFERDEIISLRIEAGQVVQDPAGVEPGVLTASELLTTFFEVPRAGRPELVEKEQRYLDLLAIDSPHPEELQLRDQLRAELEPYWADSGAKAMLLADRERKPR